MSADSLAVALFESLVGHSREKRTHSVFAHRKVVASESFVLDNGLEGEVGGCCKFGCRPSQSILHLGVGWLVGF